MINLILWIALLSCICALVYKFLPGPQIFKTIIYVLCIAWVAWMIFSFFGFHMGPPPGNMPHGQS